MARGNSSRKLKEGMFLGFPWQFLFLGNALSALMLMCLQGHREIAVEQRGRERMYLQACRLFELTSLECPPPYGLTWAIVDFVTCHALEGLSLSSPWQVSAPRFPVHNFLIPSPAPYIFFLGPCYITL